MSYLVRRNLLLYFRDKAAVFYSVLSVLIVFGIYLLFLGDVMQTGFENTEGIKFLMDSWLMAGILTITPITTALGSLNTMIVDRSYKIYKDFAASPTKRSTVAQGYVISSLLIALIMTAFAFVFAEVYIVVNGGNFLSLSAILLAFGIIVLNTWGNTFILFFCATFIKTTRAFGAISSLVGTFIGFFAGVYIPIGNLPPFVRSIVIIFPPSHGALLLRNVMMAPADQVVFQGAPLGFVEEIRQMLGVTFTIGEQVLSTWLSFLYLAIIGILFFTLSLRRMDQKEK